MRSLPYAIRNDRSRPDGRQHGAPADEGRARLRGLRPFAAAVAALVAEGATGSASLAEFVAALAPPRHLCLMVPAAYVDATIDEPRAAPRRRRHVIDGGNSHYPGRHRARRAAAPRRACTTSTWAPRGGVWGLERGYCLMIGGEDGDRAPARSDLPRARPGPGRDPAHAGPREAPRTPPSRATCTAARAAPATS